jgi:hypothetical protein
MAKLIYAALISLDGYIADEAGNFNSVRDSSNKSGLCFWFLVLSE